MSLVVFQRPRGDLDLALAPMGVFLRGAAGALALGAAADDDALEPSSTSRGASV